MLRPSCSMMYGVKGCCFSSWWFTGLNSSENSWLWTWFCCCFLFLFFVCLLFLPSLFGWLVSCYLSFCLCMCASFFLSYFSVYFLSFRIYLFSFLLFFCLHGFICIFLKLSNLFFLSFCFSVYMAWRNVFQQTPVKQSFSSVNFFVSWSFFFSFFVSFGDDKGVSST